MKFENKMPGVPLTAAPEGNRSKTEELEVGRDVEGKEMEMPRAPQWKWEVNVNSILLFLGLVGIVGGWGYTWSALETGRATNKSNIERLEARTSALETATRILDNHELRLVGVEGQIIHTAAGVRGVENAMSQLSSDIRVVREILQRLESRDDRSHLFAPAEKYPASFTPAPG